jgi:short-chain fatty acids transporter
VSRYVAAISEAVRGAAGIVLQFPFYAGIMGVMRGTGLGATVATSITRVASPKLYATLTMLAAGLINLFVPSGGGQWAVQGPIAVEASRTLDVPLELAVMAIAYGDQLTNMLQPFWALPLLAITGVKAREIIGYTAVVMIAGLAWVTVCLIALSP